jgi:TonB-dependent receptor
LKDAQKEEPAALNLRKSMPVVYCFCLLMPSVMSSQTIEGSLSGRVSDSSGSVLSGVIVELQPGKSQVVSDFHGEFIFMGIAPGSYRLSASYTGFSPFNTTVTVLSGKMTRADIELTIDRRTESILVRAKSAQGEVEAIRQQRGADNIVQVVSSRTINSLPNANVADAIGRLPSITLDRDAGEARYVQIRGTEPRLNNVTINGVTIPSPEGTVRQVKLDAIPAGLFDSIEIHKTLSASQDADAIGGTVNLRTRAADNTPQFSVTSMGGYTPIEGGRPMSLFTATLGKRFGTGNQLGALLDGSYDWNALGIDDLESSPTAFLQDGTVVPAYTSLSLRPYKYDRTRYAFAGQVDYRFGVNSTLYLRGIYSNFKEVFHKWQYTMKDTVASNGTITGSAPAVQVAHFRPDFYVGSLQAGATHSLTNTWVTWNLSASRSGAQDSAANPRTDFQAISPLSILTTCKYDPSLTTNPYLPRFSPSCTSSGSQVYNAALYSMKDYITVKSHTAQLNLQGAASLAHNYSVKSHFSTMEFGASIRNAHKQQNALIQTYLIGSSGALLMSTFLDSFANTDFYGGSYEIGPYASYSKITDYFSANRSAFSAANGTTRLSSDPNNYGLVERVSAGYLMNTTNFGRLHAQTGVRFEGTQLNVDGNYVVTDKSGAWVSTTAKQTTNSYIDVLPSIQLRYGFNKDSALRAVYSRGIARPNPYDLVPYITENEQNNTVGVGNPGLKPEFANNYDLTFEHVFGGVGLINAGFFYKDLIHPIYQFQTPITSGQYAGYTQTQMANGARSHIMGIEVGYQQRLTRLPGVLKGIGIVANYGYATSRTGALPLRSDRPAVQRQVPTTWNIGPNYELGRVSVHAGFSYNGAGIYAYKYKSLNPDGSSLASQPIGGIEGPAGDQYYYPHLQLDAQGSFRIGRGLSAVVSGLNLNNEVFGYYYGSSHFVVQREFYKPTITAGVRWTLNDDK